MQLSAKTVKDFKVAVDELTELDRLDCPDDELIASLHRDALLYGFMRCLIAIKGVFADIVLLNDGKKCAETELFKKAQKQLSLRFSAHELATLKSYLDVADYLEVMAGTQDEDVIQQSIELISGIPLIIKSLRKFVDRFSDTSSVQLVPEA